MSKKTEIWFATIPSIFGYGICLLSDSEENAKKHLRAQYYAMRKSWQTLNFTFDRAFEYFGGKIEKIELNKPYYENFGE